MQPQIIIRAGEFDPSFYDVRITLPGVTHDQLIARAKSLQSHRPYNGEEGLWMDFEPQANGPWIGISGDEITIHGAFTPEDPFDALDGTNWMPEPVLSLDNRLEIAQVVRSLIQ